MSSPEIGTSIDAAGITTNVHLAGEGPPLVLVHGSGPGVTAWLLPNMEPHVFGNCGHWTQIEHTTRFDDLVTAFFLAK